MLQIEFDLIIAATAAGSAFTTLLILFLQCNDPLAIQQHDEKVVLSHYSWNEWTP